MCIRLQTCFWGKPIEEGIFYVAYVKFAFAFLNVIIWLAQLNFIRAFSSVVIGFGSSLLFLWAVKNRRVFLLKIYFVLNIIGIIIAIIVGLLLIRLIAKTDDNEESKTFEIAVVIISIPFILMEYYFTAIIYTFWKQCKENDSNPA